MFTHSRSDICNHHVMQRKCNQMNYVNNVNEVWQTNSVEFVVLSEIKRLSFDNTISPHPLYLFYGHFIQIDIFG